MEQLGWLLLDSGLYTNQLSYILRLYGKNFVFNLSNNLRTFGFARLKALIFSRINSLLFLSFFLGRIIPVSRLLRQLKLLNIFRLMVLLITHLGKDGHLR